MFKRILKTKSFLFAVAAILAAVGARLADKIDTTAMIAAIVVAVQSMFLRDGIAKS